MPAQCRPKGRLRLLQAPGDSWLPPGGFGTGRLRTIPYFPAPLIHRAMNNPLISLRLPGGHALPACGLVLRLAR